MAGVDYTFISDLEGGRHTVAYVPAVDVSKSGVTIATGFDLGARNEADLQRLGLVATLVAKFRPYLGKRGAEAIQLLRSQPLRITERQAEQIDRAAKKAHLSALRGAYNMAISRGAPLFDALPAQAQTVIASVSFQYGTALEVRTPLFWAAVVKRDWISAVAILRDFGDDYPTRRTREAKLLETVLT